MKKPLFCSLLLALSQASCPGTLFEEIGTHLAAPISIAVDAARFRAYIVNSNNRVEFTSTTLTLLDLTDPANPTLVTSSVNPIAIPDFSGQIYFDPVTANAYLPNRHSDDAADTADTLLRIHLDETSASFGTVDSYGSGKNPFGIACCDASGRIYVVSGGGTVNVYDPADLSTSVQLSLETTLASGELVTGANATEVVLLGTQAFVTTEGGRLYVINTTEVGETGKNPIDYLILNAGELRGIATDGASLFAVDGTEDTPALWVINPASLTPIDPDTSAISEVDISTVQTTSISLGDDPNEVVVFNGRALVTNRGSDTVSVIDIASNAVTTTIPVGDEPFGMAAFTMNGTDYLYVTNLASDSISIIDLASNTVVNTFSP